jgi:AcrR family transcriptional regulator
MEQSLSYRRTHKAIINAFIEISTRKSFEKMTVQDILDEALVSRYTFYQHFHDKYEVAEYLQETLYQEFLHLIKKKLPELDYPNQSPKAFHQMIDKTSMEFVRQYYRNINAIKNIHTDTIDFDRLLKSYFMNHYIESHEEGVNRDLEARIYSNMVTAAMELYDINYISNSGSNVSLSISSAYTNAFIYAMGIHEKDAEKKLEAFIQRFYH